MSKIVFEGRLVHLIGLKELEIIPNGRLGIEDTGTIAFVHRSYSETLPRAFENAKVIRMTKDQFLFPGFIDTHIHATQYPNAGIGMDLPLLEWLEKYTFPTESSMSNTERAKTVYSKVVGQTLKQGTTLACYYSSIHVGATNILADLCMERGQRALIGKCSMDRMCPEPESVESCLRDNLSCIAHCRSVDALGDHVKAIITPRFGPSCASELLHKLGKLAKKENLPVQTHISENLGEIQLVKELFPEYTSYTDMYDGHGLLKASTILAHAIYLSESEMKLIKARGAGVSHCPASNTALSSGEAPIREMLDMGLSVGLGTDVSGGYSASILDSARMACSVSRHRVIHTSNPSHRIDIEEALYMATLGGAKVIGLEDKLGNFLPGKWFDALLIDTSIDGRVDVFQDEDDAKRVGKWAFNGDDRNIINVWVGGRRVI